MALLKNHWRFALFHGGNQNDKGDVSFDVSKPPHPVLPHTHTHTHTHTQDK